jgi:hypothetical protein
MPLLENLVKFGTVADAGRLDQLQLEAARIVTGMTASLSTLYAEITFFYNIVKGDTPVYLSDLLLRTVNQANNYNLRNANNFT